MTHFYSSWLCNCQFVKLPSQVFIWNHSYSVPWRIGFQIVDAHVNPLTTYPPPSSDLKHWLKVPQGLHYQGITPKLPDNCRQFKNENGKEIPPVLSSALFPPFCLGAFPPEAVLFSSCTFLSCFLCFILLFWNQVLTWVSLKLRAPASSTLSGVDRYLWAENRFSNPVSWGSLKTVLAFRLRQCLRAFKEISLAELPKRAWWKGRPKDNERINYNEK